MAYRGHRDESGAVSAGTRVFVGNLSFQTTWHSLKDHMRQVGEVRKADILLRDGRSIGSGVVEFSRAEEAAEAIRSLTNSSLDGRQIFVREDRDVASRRQWSDGSQEVPRGGRPTSVRGVEGQLNVYIGNLPYSTTWQSLKDFLRSEGFPNVKIDIKIDPRTNQSRGAAVVTFESHDSANEAIRSLQDKIFEGRPMNVHFDKFDGR